MRSILKWPRDHALCPRLKLWNSIILQHILILMWSLIIIVVLEKKIFFNHFCLYPFILFLLSYPHIYTSSTNDKKFTKIGQGVFWTWPIFHTVYAHWKNGHITFDMHMHLYMHVGLNWTYVDKCHKDWTQVCFFFKYYR